MSLWGKLVSYGNIRRFSGKDTVLGGKLVKYSAHELNFWSPERSYLVYVHYQARETNNKNQKSWKKISRVRVVTHNLWEASNRCRNLVQMLWHSLDRDRSAVSTLMFRQVTRTMGMNAPFQVMVRCFKRTDLGELLLDQRWLTLSEDFRAPLCVLLRNWLCKWAEKLDGEAKQNL